MKRLFSVSLVSVTLLAAAVLTQDRSITSYYKVSAEAGYINYVQGEATVETRSGSRSAANVEKVLAGEKIITSANSKVEVLLTPGSYLRLDSNSEAEFLDTSFENLKIKILAGVALFEIIATKDLSVSVLTPNAEFQLVKTGVYKFEIADNSTSLKVIKGSALVAGKNRVEKGRRAVLAIDGNVRVEKYNPNLEEEFELWSKTRSKYLAKINEKLERKLLRQSLLDSNWNWYDSFGLWIYNPRFGTYCFLPFGYGWHSPYGFAYTYDIWKLRLPVLPPMTTPSGSNPSDKTSKQDIPESITPPYMKVQKDLGKGTEIDVHPTVNFPTKTIPSTVSIPTVPSPVEQTPQIIVPSQRKGKDNN